MVVAGWGKLVMAAGDQEKGDDFYTRLGLKKECSSTELRDAYKKLALVLVFCAGFICRLLTILRV